MTRIILTLLVLAVAPGAHATDGHRHEPPAPKVIVVEKNENVAVGALIGAGITYWLVQRHMKRQQRPLVIIPPEDRSEECSAKIEQVIASCGITK